LLPAAAIKPLVVLLALTLVTDSDIVIMESTARSFEPLLGGFRIRGNDDWLAIPPQIEDPFDNVVFFMAEYYCSPFSELIKIIRRPVKLIAS
jgi:hypothetical protein